MFSNPNYHPKMTVVENTVFGKYGRGNWGACSDKCINSLDWSRNPWELFVENDGEKSEKIFPEDHIIPLATSSIVGLLLTCQCWIVNYSIW